MKEKISMLVFVIILGSISAGLLVGINNYTKPRVIKNNELKLKSSILDTFGMEYKEDTIEQVFSQNIETFQKNGVMFYKTKTNEIAFEYSGSGLWGPISGIIALKPDLETIEGIKIIHQEETPGLGGRISELEFLTQFKGKKIIPKLLIVPSGKATEKNEIDGITGATMTSKAFENILNKKLKEHLTLLQSAIKSP